MDGCFFRDSLIVIGLSLIGCLFFALLYIGLWYWRHRHIRVVDSV